MKCQAATCGKTAEKKFGMMWYCQYHWKKLMNNYSMGDVYS